MIPGASFEGYRKKYTKDNEPEVILSFEGIATESNLEVLGAPLATPHSKAWTSDRFDDEVAFTLIQPAFEGQEERIAIQVPGARLNAIGGDHQNESVHLKLTIVRGVAPFIEFEDSVGKPWAGTLQVHSQGQRVLFEQPEEPAEDDGQQSLPGAGDAAD